MPESMQLYAEQREILKHLLTRLDEQIRIELDLIGQRMNILAVSQAFLFTAYATDLTVTGQRPFFQKLAIDLLWLVPELGMAICLILGLSLFAPVWVVRTRKREREIVRDRLRQDLEMTLGTDIAFSKRFEILAHVSPNDWEHALGNWPPVALAPALLAGWIYISLIRP